jgi:hypothetical protein
VQIVCRRRAIFENLKPALDTLKHMLEIIRANFKSGSDAAAQLASALTFDPIARRQEGTGGWTGSGDSSGTGRVQPDLLNI